MPAVLTANIGSYGSADWRYWFVGAATPAAFVLSLRWGVRAGVGTVLLALAGVLVVEAASGNASWAPVLGPFPVFCGLAVVGGLVRRGLNRGATLVDAWLAQTADVQVRRIRVAAAHTELAQRRANLDRHVVPMLEHVVAGGLSPSDRLTCVLLEAAARDHLVAAALVDDAVEDAVTSARRRGARVTLSAAQTDADAEPARAFRRVLRDALQWIPAHWQLRAVFDPESDCALGSIVILGTIDGDHVGSLRTAVGTPESLHLDVTADDSSILVDVTLREHPAPVPAHEQGRFVATGLDHPEPAAEEGRCRSGDV